MKAYISRDGKGAVTKGWLLREGISIHSTMCRLRRTQPNTIQIEDATPEMVLRAASNSGVRNQEETGSSPQASGAKSLSGKVSAE